LAVKLAVKKSEKIRENYLISKLILLNKLAVKLAVKKSEKIRENPRKLFNF